jgi:hypothetical protein
MRIVRLLIFVIGAAFLDAIVTVMLKEAGVYLGAFPTMLKVAACWGLFYVIVYHVFGATKKQPVQQPQASDDKSDI